jgi:hypothetical protein
MGQQISDLTDTNSIIRNRKEKSDSIGILDSPIQTFDLTGEKIKV